MGAGVSMGSKGEDGSTHPPSWEKFLKDALKLIPDATDRKSAQVSINKYQYLDAAEIILECSNAADFTNFLREILVQPRFAPSELHRIILELDPKIIITTNYDEIYDHYCTSGHAEGGYNICRYYDR